MAPLAGGTFAIIPSDVVFTMFCEYLGWVTFYFSWRTMQGVLGVFGAFAFCVMYMFFPETSHPGSRGIDKRRAEYGPDSHHRNIGFVFINPLRLMLLLRNPNLMLIVCSLSKAISKDFISSKTFITQSITLSASLMAMLGMFYPLKFSQAYPTIL